MAATTPRRSSRITHSHTPKMLERKKGLFQGEEVVRDSLTKHRRLPVLDSESDSDDCDLGIISTLDSSSCDETDQNVLKTPEKNNWRETRSQSKKLLKETHDLKNFIKSPFTLKKYQNRYCPDTKCTGSSSTPATPHLQYQPTTPSSSHSCASVHTTSSTSSRARKSLASLIADTESCSSSLKDLNFDTDSADSKENTPTKSLRRSSRKKMTPKLSFKGILLEQKMNVSPKKAVVCLTKMEMNDLLSPTQMMKTPHNSSESSSPPKIGRRPVLEIGESPESTCDSEKSHKRLHYDNMSDGPSSKYPRLDNAPKAKISLFNSDRLKEILSAKSFYGKSNPELNTSVATKISKAIEDTNGNYRRSFQHSHSHRRKRRPGQINLGVRHRIRKPKIHKKIVTKSPFNHSAPAKLNNSTLSNVSAKDSSMLSQNSSQELVLDKADPFDKEKRTIDELLSQWTEEEIPETELTYIKRKELPCFNSTVIEETNQIFQPITAVPVSVQSLPPQDGVIVELGSKTNQTIALKTDSGSQVTGQDRVSIGSGALIEISGMVSEGKDDVMMEEGHVAKHGTPSGGQFLPVEGGYILVEGDEPVEEDILDIDKIEHEMRMLDEQILKMAASNNMDPDAILQSTELAPIHNSVPIVSETEQSTTKLFPIFSNPNPGVTTPTSKGAEKKKILKTGLDQYIIDAGQKKFGATQCSECGVIYQIGDPEDEHEHMIYHNASDVLRFNGWKEEHIVGRSQTGRCLMVRGGSAGWRKVNTLLERVIHPQLGYEAQLPNKNVQIYTAFLYIEKKQIIGCVIMEPRTKAYKFLPGDPDCCSVEEYPIKLGVSRIWTAAPARRRGVARRLLDCARAATLRAPLSAADIAFSAPTPAGRALASAYCGTPNFHVYLQ